MAQTNIRPGSTVHTPARVAARLHPQAVSIPNSTMTRAQPSLAHTTLSPSSLSDHQLLMLCTQYGTQAKIWKQKFLGLLPEVDRRQLYLKEGCTSVFEFAAKVGGVSREQVLLVLRLSRKFETTPQIKAALTSGFLPLSKLSRIASVVTPQTEVFWLNQSNLLSKGSLETLVKDTRTLTTSKPVPGHASNPNKTEEIAQSDELNLAPDIREQLLDMRNKGIDHNQVLRELLKGRNERIQEEKHNIAQELEEKEMKTSQKDNLMKADQNVFRSKPSSSRYIPQKVKQLLKQEYGEKCAHDQCTNKAVNIHHTRRFGLNPSHNPLFLAPLCKQHHEIAHSIDLRVQGHKR